MFNILSPEEVYPAEFMAEITKEYMKEGKTCQLVPLHLFYNYESGTTWGDIYLGMNQMALEQRKSQGADCVFAGAFFSMPQGSGREFWLLKVKNT